MFEILTELLDSLDTSPGLPPETAHATPAGDLLFGHHGEIQNGSYVSVPDLGEVTTAADRAELNPTWPPDPA